MISGNGLPATSECDAGVRAEDGTEREGSQALRDIQNLIAKLEVVNRLLSVPLRTRPAVLPEENSADVPDA